MADINSRVQLVYPPAPEVLEKASKVFCAFVQDLELYFRVGDADDGETDAGGWQDINATHTIKLTIYYLDTGTEDITVTYTDDGTTEYTETIVTKGNTGLWKRAHHTLAHAARFNHSLYEDFNYADFYLACDDGALYIGEVLVKDTATKVAAIWQATDDPAAGNAEFQSDNFVTGVSGFYINGDTGDAEFNNVTVRGTIYATAGEIGGLTIGADKIYVGAGNYGNADTGFYADASGKLSLKDKLTWDGTTLTVSGTVTATAGAITGTLTVSGTLQNAASPNARYTLDASGLKGYDATNTQRYQLLNDGSGWLGAANVFRWSSAGVVALNGQNIDNSTISVTKLLGVGFSNLTEDPGFEAGGSTWTVPSVIFNDPTNAHTGNYVMKATSGTVVNRNALFATCEPSENFYFRGWCKSSADADGSPRIQLAWYAANKTTELSISEFFPTVNTSWTKYEGIFTAPASAAYVRVQCTVFNQTTGTWYFDDLYLCRAVVTGHLVAGAVTADKVSVTQLSSISANLGTITAGTVTGATIRTAESGARVLMDTTGLYGYSASEGVFIFPVATIASWGAGEEALAAGDCMIGSNDTDKMNLFWDASEGTLQIRRGTTVIWGPNASGTDTLILDNRNASVLEQLVLSATGAVGKEDYKAVITYDPYIAGSESKLEFALYNGTGYNYFTMYRDEKIFEVPNGGGIRVGPTNQVVGPRITGYTAISGTANRGASYDSDSMTLVNLGRRLKAIQDDLMAHGLIGA